MAFVFWASGNFADTAWLTDLGVSGLHQPFSFQYSDLQDATENFSDVNILGNGGFAIVYKVCYKAKKIKLHSKIFASCLFLQENLLISISL